MRFSLMMLGSGGELQLPGSRCVPGSRPHRTASLTRGGRRVRRITCVFNLWYFQLTTSLCDSSISQLYFHLYRQFQGHGCIYVHARGHALSHTHTLWIFFRHPKTYLTASYNLCDYLFISLSPQLDSEFLKDIAHLPVVALGVARRKAEQAAVGTPNGMAHGAQEPDTASARKP